MKKYPIMTYLFYALIICVLFTGVTFSRYTNSTSGDYDAELSRFACSYEITDISSFSSVNSDYTMTTENSDGTQTVMTVNAVRSLKYTIRNYDAEGNVCEVDLTNSLRVYGPYDFISNLAVQISSYGEAGEKVIMPQYFIGGIIETAESGVSSVNTADFEKCGARPFDDEVLTVGAGSGVYSASGGTTGGSVTITRFNQSGYGYSLGFSRGVQKTINQTTIVDPDPTAGPFYVDMNAESEFCSLDISVPSEMSFNAGVKEEKSFILYFTPVKQLVSGGDETDASELLGEKFTAIADGVSGYHYDQSVNVYSDPDFAETKDETAAIRVKYSFDGGYTYQKITTAADLDGNVTTTAHDLNYDGGAYIEDGGVYYNIEEINNPLYNLKGDGDFVIGDFLSKDYSLSFNALFVQTKLSDGGGRGGNG